MNKILAIAAVAVAFVTLAQDTQKPDASLDKTAQRKEVLAKAMAKAGGFIDKPGEGKPILIVDTRKDTDGAAVRVKEVLDTMLRLPCKCETAELADGKCPFEFALEKLKADMALLVVVVVECGKSPSLAVFPEDRIAVVNAKKVNVGADDKDGKLRIIREIWRAIGFVCGAGYAANENDVMQPIVSPLELDAIQWQVLNPNNGPKIDRFLMRHNVRRGHRMSYRKACEQGWAPAPTNDIQKTVWDEVQAAKDAKSLVPVVETK